MVKDRETQDATAWDSESDSYSSFEVDGHISDDEKAALIKTVNFIRSAPAELIKEKAQDGLFKEKEMPVEVPDDVNTGNKSKITLQDLHQGDDNDGEAERPIAYVEEQKRQMTELKRLIDEVSDDDLVTIEEAPKRKLINVKKEVVFEPEVNKAIQALGASKEDQFLLEFITNEGWKNTELDWRKQHKELARSREDLIVPTVLRGKEKIEDLVEDDRNLYKNELLEFEHDMRHEIEERGVYAKGYKLLGHHIPSARIEKLGRKKRRRVARKQRFENKKIVLLAEKEKEKADAIAKAKVTISEYWKNQISDEKNMSYDGLTKKQIKRLIKKKPDERKER